MQPRVVYHVIVVIHVIVCHCEPGRKSRISRCSNFVLFHRFSPMDGLLSLLQSTLDANPNVRLQAELDLGRHCTQSGQEI